MSLVSLFHGNENTVSKYALLTETSGDIGDTLENLFISFSIFSFVSLGAFILLSFSLYSSASEFISSSSPNSFCIA